MSASPAVMAPPLFLMIERVADEAATGSASTNSSPTGDPAPSEKERASQRRGTTRTSTSDMSHDVFTTGAQGSLCRSESTLDEAPQQSTALVTSTHTQASEGDLRQVSMTGCEVECG